MRYDTVIITDGLKVGDLLVSQGVFYAPYNKIKCTWMNERAIVAHVGSHKQYWSQQAHNIAAHFIVFRKIGENEYGNWYVVKDWEKETGRQFGKIKAEAIAYAESIDEEER